MKRNLILITLWSVILSLNSCATKDTLDIGLPSTLTISTAKGAVTCKELSGRSLIQTLGNEPFCMLMAKDHTFTYTSVEECNQVTLGHPYCADVWTK